VRAAGIEPAISGASGRRSPAELRAHRAGGENRTHLEQLGRLPPRQSASPALVPPVGLEPTHFRVRTGCSAFELRRQCRSDVACDALHDVPPPGIEPEPPGLQPGAQTIYARVASRGVGTPRCHRIHLSWPPPAPCRCRSAVSFARGTVDSRVLQSAAVRAERVELPFPGSEPGVLPVERSPNVIGLDKIERSPRVASIDKHCGSGWSRTTSFKTTTGLQPGTLPFGHTPGPRS
jgi:hypothetical protein